MTLKNIELKTLTELRIRFSEVDSLKIVWHGNYAKYLEEGREDFGRKYNIGYMDVLKQGFVTPVVNMTVNYKKPLFYGDKAIIETRYIDTDAAKMIFSYSIFNKKSGELVATAETTQVFLTTDMELHITVPKFFEEWKKVANQGE